MRTPTKNKCVFVPTVIVAFVMSPKFGVSGQWWAKTALGNGSVSENHADFQPSGFQATVAARIPLHTHP